MKLCIDCKHYGPHFRTCSHHHAQFDIVDGSPLTLFPLARDVFGSGGICGKEGRLFEDKNNRICNEDSDGPFHIGLEHNALYQMIRDGKWPPKKMGVMHKILRFFK